MEPRQSLEELVNSAAVFFTSGPRSVKIYNMNMRKQKIRYWLGHLMLIAMLFTQSFSLWARVNIPVQSHHHMQQDCHGQQTIGTDSQQQHCKQDCCHHDHSCSSQCLTVCVAAGVNLLPTTMTTVRPIYQISSTHLFPLLSPDGMHATVLDRPPRDIS